MAKHFQRTPKDARYEIAHRFDNRMNPLPDGQWTGVRHGHPVKKRIKAPCKRCNSGWMSRIEDVAKPLFERLMYGEVVELTEADQRILSEWTFMKMCIFEGDPNVRAIIPSEMKHCFYADRTIPNWTHIFLLRHIDPAWFAQMHRHSAGFLKGNPSVIEVISKRNTQAFTIGIGQLLIYAFQCFVVDMEPELDQSIWRKICPVTGQTVHWPPPYVLRPGQPTELTEGLGEFVKNWPT